MSQLGLPILRRIESVVLFVPDIEAAAAWYASVLGVSVEHENSKYAYVRGAGTVIGFHPADGKCPGGVGATSVYWEVASLAKAVESLVAKGARVHRGPGTTSFRAKMALLIDPFGCTIGLNEPSNESKAKLSAGQAQS